MSVSQQLKERKQRKRMRKLARENSGPPVQREPMPTECTRMVRVDGARYVVSMRYHAVASCKRVGSPVDIWGALGSAEKSRIVAAVSSLYGGLHAPT